jgi:ribonuclease P protein component
MLAKKIRIKKSDFTELLRSGRSFYSDNFILKAMKAKNIAETSRFAVIISKKVASKAVTRNFLKRRSKYALMKKLMIIKKGFIIALWIKKDLSQLKYKNFEAEIISLLEQANLINA